MGSTLGHSISPWLSTPELLAGQGGRPEKERSDYSPEPQSRAKHDEAGLLKVSRPRPYSSSAVLSGRSPVEETYSSCSKAALDAAILRKGMTAGTSHLSHISSPLPCNYSKSSSLMCATPPYSPMTP